MGINLRWQSCMASLLLVFCLSVSGQAGESNDLASDDMATVQAQAGPQYAAQVAPAACSTAGYKVDDAVVYAFEDISGTGTNLGLGDDGEIAIGIGFTFNFYCASYNTVTVGGNGALSFDDPATPPNITTGNQPLPFTTTNFTTLVAGFWDDLDPGEPGAAVFYEVRGSAPNRRLIVQWNAVPHFPTSDPITFEIILFESTNKILFKYQDVNFANAAYDFGASATVGIQKDGTTAVQYSYNTASLADGDAILFTSQAFPCPTSGYYYDDMVPYSFEDISGTGTDLGLTTDAYEPVPLPFTFSFYCAEYATIYVNDSGVINFADQDQTYSNTCLPATTDAFPTFIAPFWDDIVPGAVYYQVKGASPNRRMIIQWDGVSAWPGGGSSITFQVILYETTNKILFQYADVTTGDGIDSGAAATVGIQGDSASAVQYSCDTPSLSDGLAILFSPYMEVIPPYSPAGIDYDCHRNGIWVADDSAGGGSLVMLDPVSGAVVKTIAMIGKVIGADGQSNDVAVLDNGNLLLTDFGGDGGVNINDYLYEFNPDTETLVNYWPLSGTLNTATDGSAITSVRGVEMVFEPFRRTYVTRSGDNNVYEVQLTPGKPGTWKTLAVHAPPSLLNSAGIDKVACYEDTPITGIAIADRGSSVINFYTDNFVLNSNFDAQHGISTANYGVTVVPGNPAKLWVSDLGGSNKIGIFDTQQKCTMHCGKFPWHEIIGAISQGTSAP